MKRRGGTKTTVVVGLLIMLGLICLTGSFWPGELVFWIVAGWPPFLHRVAAQATPDWYAIATGFGALAAFALGLHLFLRWLYSAMRSTAIAGGESSDSMTPKPEWAVRWTLSAVAIIVMLFVAGISMVGITHQIAWLAASRPLFEPNSFRQSVGRLQSSNNLKTMWLALDMYQAKHGSYPGGVSAESNGSALHSWQTSILPYIERQPLFDQIDQEQPWNAVSQRKAFSTWIRSFLIPQRDLPERDSEGYALSHYAANQHVLGGDAALRRGDITDGASNTLVAGEAAANFKPWGNPTNLRDPALGINASADGFGSPWASPGAHFVFADGHVRFISNKTDPKVLRALATPAGGERIPSDY